MSRRHTTIRQYEVLLDFMEQHRDLALGKIRSVEYREDSKRLWASVLPRLNCEGPSRSQKEWVKFWSDYKCKVRSKLACINRSRTQTGGGPSTAIPLTPLEERVANIIGHDFGPIPNVRQDPFHGLVNLNQLEDVQDIRIEQEFSRVNDPEDVEPSPESLEIEVPLVMPQPNEERAVDYMNFSLNLSPPAQPNHAIEEDSESIMWQPPSSNQATVRLSASIASPLQQLPRVSLVSAAPTMAVASPRLNINSNSILESASILPQPPRRNQASVLEQDQPESSESGVQQRTSPARPARAPRAPRAARARAGARLPPSVRDRPRARPAVPGAAHVSHINNLEESKAALVRIEEKRVQMELLAAQTAEAQAQANLLQAHAARMQAEAFTSISVSARILANCCRRLLRRSRNQNN